jgi:hypothetical protein
VPCLPQTALASEGRGDLKRVGSPSPNLLGCAARAALRQNRFARPFSCCRFQAFVPGPWGTLYPPDGYYCVVTRIGHAEMASGFVIPHLLPFKS